MSHWHYQLMKHKVEHDGVDFSYYAIHEIYPLDDGDAWTENPVTVTGESTEDVKKSLMLMLKDIDKHGVKDYE